VDWVWDNFQLIVVVAGVIAVWINQRRREQAGQEADYDQDGIPENRPFTPEVRELAPRSRDGSDPEQDERVRRIREEIRRKIAERRGESPAPRPFPAPVEADEEASPFEPVARPAPVFPRAEPEAPALPRTEPPPLFTPAPTASPYADTATMERQRALADQMEELQRTREETRRRALELAGNFPQADAAPKREARPAADEAARDLRGLRRALRDPATVRRAIVMREVLGPPVGLR
jgi:hypothetical protein